MSKLPTKRKVVDKSSSPHVWVANPMMEKDFIDFCIESASLHGYTGASLKSWTPVITRLNKTYNTSFDQKALKNKWTNLRLAYQTWRKLIHTTGHGRKEDGSFDWPDEQWKAAIERDPKAARYRFEPLKHFREMEQLFEGTYAVGDENTTWVDVEADGVGKETPNSEVEADVLQEYEVDLNNDEYFSGNLNTASPGNVDSSNTSPAVMSKLSEGSAGKRKRVVGDLDGITEILRDKFELDKAMALKGDANLIDECNSVIDAMKLIPEVYMDKKRLAKAKINLCGSIALQKTFLAEVEVEDKVIFLETLADL